MPSWKWNRHSSGNLRAEQAERQSRSARVHRHHVCGRKSDSERQQDGVIRCNHCVIDDVVLIGLRRTGWGLIAVDGSRLTHIAHGVICPPDKLDLAERLPPARSGYFSNARMDIDFW